MATSELSDRTLTKKMTQLKEEDFDVDDSEDISLNSKNLSSDKSES